VFDIAQKFSMNIIPATRNLYLRGDIFEDIPIILFWELDEVLLFLAIFFWTVLII